MEAKARTVSGKILHNSFWFGLETILESVIFIGTSVALARFFGPSKMGYFIYINFFVTTVTRTGGTGLASATRKFMAEFLAANRPGMACGVYKVAYRYQLLGSITLVALGLLAVVLFGDPNYRLMSIIMIVSIIPGQMSWVPAQANNAFEDAYPNTVSALGYLGVYALVIFLTLCFHWDLVGIASATLAGRSAEVILRTIPLNAKLRALPMEEVPDDLLKRIRRYCLEAIGIQLLMSVVWDRSEMIFLRAFSTLDQIAFYGISIGLADKLLLIPRTLGFATGITLMVESGRENGRVNSIVKNAARYLLLVTFPVNLGAAAVATTALALVYGAKYHGAGPVMVVASVLGIARAFQEMPDVLLRAADRQKQLLLALVITGVFNLGIDRLLIPRFGAVGAAWGNGLSQALGILAIWQLARRAHDFSFPWKDAARLLAAGLTMTAVAVAAQRLIPGLPGLIAAVATAIPTYLVMVKLMRVLGPADCQRLAPIGNRLPGPMQRAYGTAIAFISHGD